MIVRVVLTFFLGLFLAPLSTTEAQQLGKMYRIGVLTNVPPTAPEASRLWEAFQQGLRERGWVEGQNIVIEYRWVAGQFERFPSLAAELVGLKVDLIVTVSTLCHSALYSFFGCLTEWKHHGNMSSNTLL